MKTGKVYLVGAGPGEAGLITVKGLRLIKQADVILYDHLISPELVPIAGAGAEKIPVGKFAGQHTLPQDEINRLLVEKAREGKTVVRLKGGDPYLFGRGGEEAQACVRAGVDFEVVPGVTSALSAACYAGIPPTHRDCTSDIAIVTGHRRDDGPMEVPKAGTVIFLMSVGNVENIISSLLRAGWSAETKIAAVEHATWYDQRVIEGTLDNFLTVAQKAILRTPAVFVVGKVVEMRHRLDWFAKKPNVLVMGNHTQRYAYLGNVVHRRIIECVPVDDYSAADIVLKDIASFDWVVFTSVNAARYLFQRLTAMGMDSRAFGPARIAAIGRSTAARLGEFGIVPDMVSDVESSLGLVEEFRGMDMAGQKVLLPQPQVASSELELGLDEMGALCTKTVVYKTIDCVPDPVDFDFIDIVLFTSGSTVRAFVKHFGKVPANVRCLCLGRPTQRTAAEYGITAEIAPTEHEH